MKVVFFDLDSTICSTEGLNELAQFKNIGKEVEKITLQTMEGDLSFREAFPGKVRLIAPSIDDIDRMTEMYFENISPGFQESVDSLKSFGYEIGVISGNFQRAISPIAERFDLNLNYIFGTEIEHHEDRSFKHFNPDQLLVRDDGKDCVIRSLRGEKTIEQIIFVGDSYGDMLAGREADLFIGYGGAVVRDRVREEAQHYVYNMDEIAPIIKNKM